jgi:hypothetical protein
LIAAPFLANGAAQLVSVLAALIFLPATFMILRCRSIILGLYSVVAWNAYALCFIPGLLRRRTDPAAWIESREIEVVADVVGALSRVVR